MSDNLPMTIIAARVREYAKSHEVRVSGDFPEALNEYVIELIASAVRRCKANKRGTLKPSDL